VRPLEWLGTHLDPYEHYFVLGMTWLVEAETMMPDIFRAMVGKSDNQVIEELWYFMEGLWRRNKQQPIHTSALRRFLMIRAPSDKIEPIIRAAEGADVIARKAGTEDLWLPRPKHLHGMES